MARPSDPLARGRLLAAAQRVFAARGLDRSRVEEISAEAGVSKGAFYLHFASKEEAFREVVTHVLSRLERFLEEDCLEPSSAADALEKWLAGDIAIFDYVWEHRELVRLVMEGGGSADYRHLVDHFAERVQSHLESLLRFGITSGWYRVDLDVQVAAAFLSGGYDRFARRLVRENRKPNLRAVARELQELVVRGIGSARLTTELTSRTSAEQRQPSGVTVEPMSGAEGPPVAEGPIAETPVTEVPMPEVRVPEVPVAERAPRRGEARRLRRNV